MPHQRMMMRVVKGLEMVTGWVMGWGWGWG
jgi:hypothetical protein